MVQSTGDKLIKAIAYQAEKASYFCTAENISSNQKVHELRRTFKRMRALLSFFRENTNGNAAALKKKIRKFGRLLSPLRESAVNIILFDRIIVSGDIISEKTIRKARELLDEKNKYLVEKYFLENNLFKNIQEFLYEFENKLIAGNNKSSSRSQLLSEIYRSYGNSIDVYNKLPENINSEELHNLRKRMKHLWYQIDFVRFANPRFFKIKTDQLIKITEQLGDDHDLHVFREYLLSDEYGFVKEELQILEKQIEHQQELNLLKLELRLKQFFLYSPDEFNQKLELIFHR